jgi:hypothetical protein
MPVIERWVWEAYNCQIDVESANAFFPNPAQFGLESHARVEVGVYTMLGFDNITFQRSMPSAGNDLTAVFPQVTTNRPGVQPFVGWSRWTASSHVIKLGMLWSFPVLQRNSGKTGSLHIEVEPSTLRRYADLFDLEFEQEALNPGFYLMNSKVGDKTRARMSTQNASRLKIALENLEPLCIQVTIPVAASKVNKLPLDLSIIKLAWLNMRENTWSVLCNTTVSTTKTADGNTHLNVIVFINSSLFFDYYGEEAWQYPKDIVWKDVLTGPYRSFNRFGFNSNVDEITAQGPVACFDCDPKLQDGGPCNGCGGRFELFSFAGCYKAPAVWSDSYPLSWETSGYTSIYASRKVLGCTYKVIPTTSSDRIILSPGYGFWAAIYPSTFNITTGVGLCVTPMPNSSTFIIPDLVSLRATGSLSGAYSDLARLYYDSVPTKNILVQARIRNWPSSLPIAVAKNFAALSWYSVSANMLTPMCTLLPIVSDSISVLFPPILLSDPDFTNGAYGCPDVSLASRRLRCDGFGARLVIMKTTSCAEFTPSCTSKGVCLQLGPQQQMKFVNSSGVNVRVSISFLVPAQTFSSGHYPLIAVWADSLLSVWSDTWNPEITFVWDSSLTNGEKVELDSSVTILRVLFSGIPEKPIQISVIQGIWLEGQVIENTKLAWYNRTTLSWFPLCNSTAADNRNGTINATLDTQFLQSADFQGRNVNLSCIDGQLTKESRQCQHSGMLALVQFLPNMCPSEGISKLIVKNILC